MKFLEPVLCKRLIMALIILRFKVSGTTEEDNFVKHFGNDPNKTKTWPDVKAYFDDPNNVKLHKFISGTHKTHPGWQNVNIDIEEAVYKKAILKFKSTNYTPMRVEVVGYRVRLKSGTKQDLKALKGKEGEHWYFMQGLKKECVYYLTKITPDTDPWEFYLDKHVCGIKLKF